MIRVEHTLVRLFSGTVTEAEVRLIELQPEEFQSELRDTSAVISKMEALVDDLDILAIAASPRLKTIEKLRSHWLAIAVAASVLLAVLVGLGTYVDFSDQPATDIKRYVTRIGEQKTVSLTDGSNLTLNTGTEALVEMANDKRKVILERGEIYFDVAGEASRPFSVDLGIRTITVLGTKFSVLKLPEKYRVIVEEGMVSLHKTEEVVSDTAPLLQVETGALSDGETSETGRVIDMGSPAQWRIPAGWVVDMDVETGQLNAHMPDNMDRELVWRHGLLEFHMEPLFKVVKELNRYTAKKILIEEKDIMDLSVYAAINLKELRNALTGLERLLPVKVISHYDQIVIIKDEARFKE